MPQKKKSQKRYSAEYKRISSHDAKKKIVNILKRVNFDEHPLVLSQVENSLSNLRTHIFPVVVRLD